MDCHVFRRLCEELVPALLGARMEKIHQPADSVTMFTLYAQGRKRMLFLRAGRKNPFLFLASHRVQAGTEPPAFVMRLRKHLSGQRIICARVLWLERRLLLRVNTPPDKEGQVWLDLDLREGPRLLLGVADEPEDHEHAWPLAGSVDLLSAAPADRDAWPMLSPALRRTLPLLEQPEQAALLADLEYGGSDLFAYGLQDPETDAPQRSPESVELSAWPLPAPLRRGRPEQVFTSALLAAEKTGEATVIGEMARRAGQLLAKTHKDEAKRLARLLNKLENERQRLQSMADGKADAMALQAELYRFPAGKKSALAQLLSRPQTPLALNPRFTVRENMALLFHQAERGERGLAMLRPRMERILEEQAACLKRAEQAASARTLAQAVQEPSPSSSRRAEIAPQAMKSLPKNVQAFRSDEGFLLLRGRDAEGNARLLKLAAPHDYWLHTGGAAGAHVLIRRDHGKQEIPEKTLLQAGLLAAQKSERKGDMRVEIIAALVRYVRPLRAAGGKGRAGNVRIDEVALTYSVPMDGTVPEPEALQTAHQVQGKR